MHDGGGKRTGSRSGNGLRSNDHGKDDEQVGKAVGEENVHSVPLDGDQGAVARLQNRARLRELSAKCQS